MRIVFLALAVFLCACRDPYAGVDTLVLDREAYFHSSLNDLKVTIGGEQYRGVWGLVDTFDGADFPDDYLGPNHMYSPIVFSLTGRFASVRTHFTPIPNSTNGTVYFSFAGVEGEELSPVQALDFRAIYVVPESANECIQIGKFKPSDSKEDAARRAVEALESWGTMQSAGE